MWIAVPAAVIYAAYTVVLLRRQPRHHRVVEGDTVFVVSMTERVRSEL